MNKFQRTINKITPKFIKQSIIKGYAENQNFKSWIGKTFLD